VFVDASAIVALLTLEPDADSLADRLERVASPITSPVAVFESVLGVARVRRSPIDDAKNDVREFLAIAGVVVVELTAEDSFEALTAFSRYGKGRHKATLNMGDCFAYACAKTRGLSLLFKGDDFIHTDIAKA
jgi:ribonuclease VapC